MRHCRTHGGDRAFERHGVSLRYGIGVPHEQHAEYLARVGLQPETGADGWDRVGERGRHAWHCVGWGGH